MATYAQLESEPWWGREIPTSAMTGAGLMLRGAYGTGPGSFGIKGNNKHLNGGHRSQEWIKNSAYVDPPGSTYTVQSGLSLEQQRFIGAFDFTPGAWGTAANRALMIAITNRLDAAYRAGLLDGIVRQFFGTKDGKTVFGRDVPTGRQISADDSHLDHAHVGVNRARADDNDAMALVARIMIGSEDSMEQTDKLAYETANPNRKVGQVFADLSNLRDYLYAPPDTSATVNPPPAGSREALLHERVKAIEEQTAGLQVKLEEILDAVKAIDPGTPGGGITLTGAISGTVTGSFSGTSTGVE